MQQMLSQTNGLPTQLAFKEGINNTHVILVTRACTYEEPMSLKISPKMSQRLPIRSVPTSPTNRKSTQGKRWDSAAQGIYDIHTKPNLRTSQVAGEALYICMITRSHSWHPIPSSTLADTFNLSPFNRQPLDLNCSHNSVYGYYDHVSAHSSLSNGMVVARQYVIICTDEVPEDYQYFKDRVPPNLPRPQLFILFRSWPYNHAVARWTTARAPVWPHGGRPGPRGQPHRGGQEVAPWFGHSSNPGTTRLPECHWPRASEAPQISGSSAAAFQISSPKWFSQAANWRQANIQQHHSTSVIHCGGPVAWSDTLLLTVSRVNNSAIISIHAALRHLFTIAVCILPRCLPYAA